MQELLDIPDTEERKRRAVELAAGQWLARAGEPPAHVVQPAEPSSLPPPKRKTPQRLATEKGQQVGMRQWATGSRKKKAAEGTGKGTASAGKQLPISELQQRLVAQGSEGAAGAGANSSATGRRSELAHSQPQESW